MTIQSPWKTGYTPAVSSKKGLIGFDSLCNRCDASRSSTADRAALLSVPPFLGGSDGRPQGLPVRASGSRSVNPFEPPPPFDSGAAVVANRTAWRPHMAFADNAPDLGVRITIKLDSSESRWIGTRQELESEGIVPAGIAWPNSPRCAYWEQGGQRFTLSKFKERFRLVVNYYGTDRHTRDIALKAKELSRLIHSDKWTKAEHAEFKRWIEAKDCLPYQQFMRKVLGHKRRGRLPGKSNEVRA